ncbi:MAG: lysostaphin resistance A-like protein [Dehalococcoidia bacterium]
MALARRMWLAALFSSLAGLALAAVMARRDDQPGANQPSGQALASKLPPVLAGSVAISLLYFSLIAAAEVMTNYLHPQGGILLHTSLTFLLILHASSTHSTTLRNLLLALAPVPMIRVVSLALPLGHFSQIYWYLLAGLPLIVVALVVMRTVDYSARSVGLTLRHLPLQAPIAVTGVGFGITEYFILKPEPLVGALTWQQVVVPALILLVATGFAEELLFRGVLQKAALEALGFGGVVYVTLLFAALHMGYNSALDVVFVFGVGLFLALAIMRTGSLLGATLSHGLTNIVLFLVVPFWLGG